MTGKPVYFPPLDASFVMIVYWGMCKVSKLCAMSKMESSKIDRIVRRCMVFDVLCFAFVSIECVSFSTFLYTNLYHQLKV